MTTAVAPAPEPQAPTHRWHVRAVPADVHDALVGNDRDPRHLLPVDLVVDGATERDARLALLRRLNLPDALVDHPGRPGAPSNAGWGLERLLPANASAPPLARQPEPDAAGPLEWKLGPLALGDLADAYLGQRGTRLTLELWADGGRQALAGIIRDAAAPALGAVGRARADFATGPEMGKLRDFQARVASTEQELTAAGEAEKDALAAAALALEAGDSPDAAEAAAVDAKHRQDVLRARLGSLELLAAKARDAASAALRAHLEAAAAAVAEEWRPKLEAAQRAIVASLSDLLLTFWVADCVVSSCDPSPQQRRHRHPAPAGEVERVAALGLPE